MIVIDGHNLIPKITGLSLQEIDDEKALIDLLVSFARAQGESDPQASDRDAAPQQRKKPARPRGEQIEVFFDGAPPGHAGQRNFGRVTAHFVAAGLTADEAIRRYLVTLGKQAQQVKVVTSDRMVKANAKALRATVIPSEVFAAQLEVVQANRRLRKPAPVEKPKTPEPPAKRKGEIPFEEIFVDEPETQPASGPVPRGSGVDDWLEMFGIDPDDAERPIELGKKDKKPVKRKETPRKNHGFDKKD